MSFAEQERALFDLLFNSQLRDNFIKNNTLALKNYDLNQDELADFATINPHGLALDARVRTDLILAQWCRSLPLSFSLLSSVTGGLSLVKSLVDSQTMSQAPNDRIVYFATSLRQALIAKPLISLDELSLVVAVLDAELGMASTSRLLKHSIVNEQFEQPIAAVLNEQWQTKPITLAAYVSAAILPQAYSELKHALCPCLGAELWRHINKTPLLALTRHTLFKKTNTRLLVCRAVVNQMSLCEPSIDHVTVELSEGFASLFDYVNGTMSVNEILLQLKKLGANPALLQSIEAGFKQLLVAGMINAV